MNLKLSWVLNNAGDRFTRSFREADWRLSQTLYQPSDHVSDSDRASKCCYQEIITTVLWVGFFMLLFFCLFVSARALIPYRGFLSSAAGMHCWKIIFTLDLTSYKALHAGQFKTEKVEWGNPQLQYVLFKRKYDAFSPGSVSRIASFQSTVEDWGKLIKTRKPCAIKLDPKPWLRTDWPIIIF